MKASGLTCSQDTSHGFTLRRGNAGASSRGSGTAGRVRIVTW
jgi:hypothetical protein